MISTSSITQSPNHPVTRSPIYSMLRNFYRWQAVAILVLLFLWLYGRFACRLEFVLDDYIETSASLSRPLRVAIIDSFTGRLTWSGYRPLSYSVRAGLAHLWGMKQSCGYHSVSLALHLINTLLLFQLTTLFFASAPWAFLAALLFLLLPSHNEAVLYMSANANLLALFFVLLTLLAWFQGRAKGSRGWIFCAWGTYLLGILAYEVILPLPILLLALEWVAPAPVAPAPPRPHRLLFYGGLLVVALATLGLRAWAIQGQLLQTRVDYLIEFPVRADYQLQFTPAHLWRGYQILWGQLFLLHTSAWTHLPLFVNVREWISPLNPRALLSVFLTVGLTGWLLFTGVDNPPRLTTRILWRWVGWALLWLLLFSLPFAALAGRNPENRYTYLPSLGFAVGITALAALIGQIKLGHWLMRGLVRGLVTSALLAVVGVYAYVDTSDVAEWERAALHLRAFQRDLPALLPAAPGTADHLVQVGVPGDVGTAYLFTTPESFAAAMNLRYGWPVSQTDMGDLHLREWLTNHPINASHTYLVAYAKEKQRTFRIDEVFLCSPELTCLRYTMAGAGDNAVDTARYVQIFGEAERQQPGLSLLFAADDAGAQQVQSCWAFYDVQAVKVDPRTFDQAALTARCQAKAAALHDKVQ